MAADPRRHVQLETDRDDITALQVLYDSIIQADRARAPSADDLRRVRRLIRELDRGYTKAFGAMPSRARCADLIGAS
jgi:hypothetical protein